MIVLTINFLTGSYHATPWGKHVNEGVPEWPPSPWRLIRAIIATWKITKPELSDETVWPILQKMIKDLPDFDLPDASVSHTRHYMPTTKSQRIINGSGENNQLIINTFVVVGSQPVRIMWKDLIFNEKEMDIMKSILKNLHYLGRAESWCTVSISATSNNTPNSSPFQDVDSSETVDLVRTLVPNSAVEFEDLCKQNPENLNSISITTQELQDKKYIDPPGGKWIYYTRPQNCFEGNLGGHTRTSLLNNVTVIRYAVVGTVRPSIKDTLRIGDLTRTACMSRFGRMNNGNTSTVFSGKDGSGKPLKNHGHAFYLPTYETQNNEIDNITIIAQNGFDKDELDVLFSLKKLYRYNEIPTQLVFQGCGAINDFTNIPIFAKSKRWQSATPLVLTRHTKYRKSGSEQREIDGPKEQISNEIKKRFSDEYELKNINIHESNELYKTNVKPHEFFRWRTHGRRGFDKAYNVELEFSQQVQGPIALGYASHFGLGMFVPVED